MGIKMKRKIKAQNTNNGAINVSFCVRSFDTGQREGERL